MGCTASKLDNEDTVRRCKDRRRLMKEAVYARHHLAAAHSDYCRSLRITGSALCTFAAGEPLSISENTPAVFLNPSPPSPSAASAATINHPPAPPHIPTPSPSLHPPPPPPFSPSPSPTIASSKLPHILSSSSIASAKPRRKPLPKLPHILSESSPSSSPQSQRSNFPSSFFPTAHQANSTYSSTPSQASSVWNWENFYPPSPPDSEYFRNRAQNQQSHFHKLEENHGHHLETEDFEGEETERSEYDFFQNRKPEPIQNRKHQYQHHDEDTEKFEYDFFQNRKPEPIQSQKDRYQHHDQDYTETEREEVQCSEWGDHYSTTTSSDEEEEDAESRSEIGTRPNFGSSVRAESVTRASTTPAPPPKMYRTPSKTEKFDDGGSSASYRTGEVMDMTMVVRHRDLREIVEAIKDNFEKAARAGDQVSEMLEISKAQLDRSFRQLRSKFFYSNVKSFTFNCVWLLRNCGRISNLIRCC